MACQEHFRECFFLHFNISPLSASDNRNTVPKVVEMQFMKVINTSRDRKFHKPWEKYCEVCLNLVTRLFLCWVSSEGRILHYGLYTMSGRSAYQLRARTLKLDYEVNSNFVTYCLGDLSDSAFLCFTLPICKMGISCLLNEFKRNSLCNPISTI